LLSASIWISAPGFRREWCRWPVSVSSSSSVEDLVLWELHHPKLIPKHLNFGWIGRLFDVICDQTKRSRVSSSTDDTGSITSTVGTRENASNRILASDEHNCSSRQANAFHQTRQFKLSAIGTRLTSEGITVFDARGIQEHHSG
jgi:hypothetical protein